MAIIKEVKFINRDAATGLFYEDTVNATVIDGSETTLTSGVYVVEGSFLASDFNINNLTIEGEVKLILADGSQYEVAGINVTGSLTIYGQQEGTGKLDSKADGEFSEAGIQVSDGNTFTVIGGQVVATGVNGGAGIGGADGEAVSHINIFGGDVNAKGGSTAAGIGSGNGANADWITIDGGHVQATGGADGAAGIGGGKNGAASNITINGGEVYATGGENAAGIGSGATPDSSTNGLTINNGGITAQGGDGGAGIGGGKAEVAGTEETGFVNAIYINGGNVSAIKGQGDNVWAIGKGDGTEAYPVSDIYVSEDMQLKGDGSVIAHSSVDDLSNHRDGYKNSKLHGKSTLTAATKHLTYNDSQDDNYDITSDKANIGYYENENAGGGYIYVTDGMSLTNSEAVEFSNFYVNGDTAHGGVICADEEGGVIDLVDVDFTNNRVVHNSQEAAGGAIYSNGNNATTLVRCDFTNNWATGYRQRSYGGAVAVTGEAPLTIKDSVFTGNLATSEGGAVWNSGNFLVSESTFLDGYADKGGAVYATGESKRYSQRIVNTTFKNNTASYGGAVYVDVGSVVSIEGSDFLANSAHTYGFDVASGDTDLGDHRGGAVYVAGDKWARTGGTAEISDTDFAGNYAKQGAGLYVDAFAKAKVKNADFIENVAAEEGGAIYVNQEGTLDLDNVYLSGNKSTVSGSDGEVLTQNCAVYNKGEINLVSEVKVDANASDVIYNRGRVNWDTNGEQANGFISDLTRFNNEGSDSSYRGSFGITVNDGDLEGITRYVIAEKADFDNLPEDTATSLKSFVLNGIAGQSDKVIVADGSTVEYNGKTYRLYTTDAASYNQLILAVEPSQTERDGHIVIDREHFNGAVLNTAGEFKDFQYGEDLGGAVLLTEGAAFSAHDSIFAGNAAEIGGAIYAVADSKVNLTDVTFSGNASADGASGALYIAEGATVTLYGDVTLSTASDTIANYGNLVWSISDTDSGYLSDYSLLNNAKTSTMVIENAPKSTYGKYLLADNAQSADGAKFLLSEGGSEVITVNSEDWVSCGNMEARVYVDEDKKYSLWLEVRATRIDVALETYTMQDDYVVDMTAAPSYEGDGGLIYVHSNGRLQNDGSVKITGAYATGNGGAVYSEGNVKLGNAKFINNHSNGKGGAIYGEGVKLTLSDSTFSGNASDEGGAIWNLDGTTILDNVTFSNNTAIGDGGAIYGGDIDLRGDVYLSSESDTVWMEEGKTLNWTIDGNDTGYISDFSLITGNVDAETFTIDAEDALVGHCYTLAGNAGTSEGQTFAITVTGYDGAEMHTMTVGGDSLLVDDVTYSLGLNDSDELTLSVNQHLVVEDYTMLIDSVQDFSWSGMDTYSGNGSIFEIRSSGIMTNISTDGEVVSSYAVTFKDGSATGNGGIIYNAGNLTLDSAYFEANTAEGNGGAIYSNNQAYITNGSFFYNEAENGGALYVAGGSENYLSGNFSGNSASNQGGAVYVASDAALTMGDTSFKGNEADEGGAIYNEGNILLTGELALASSDDSLCNLGTLTLDYASGASILGYQYLMNVDEGKVCISVAGLEEGNQIYRYEFAKGDFSGDYEYVDEFTLTDGISDTSITVGGGSVELNNRNYLIEINETGDALLLSAYTKKDITITLYDMTKVYDGLAMTCTDYIVSDTLEGEDELFFTISDSITDAGTKEVDVGSWKVMRGDVDVSHEYNLTSTGCTLTVTPREVTIASGNATKLYDGKALTCDTITVGGDGFAADEGATYKVTGRQTEFGSSANTFTYKLDDNTKAENYVISTVEGSLTVKTVVNNYNNSTKSDMIQFVDGKVYVTYDTESGYQQTDAINDVTGWSVVETRRDLTGDGLADVQITSDDGHGSTWVATLVNGFDGDIKLDYKFIGAYNNELWNYLGSADVNADGKSEVLMVQTDKGADENGHRNVAAWVTDDQGTWVDNEWVGALTSNWEVAGTADVTGDGQDNVILRREDGMLGYWSEAGSNEIVKLANSGSDVLLTTADFDGDGADDFLFTNAEGEFRVWSNLGNELKSEDLGNLSDLGDAWTFAGAGDYNGDGKDEILWCDTEAYKVAYGEANQENFSKLVTIV